MTELEKAREELAKVQEAVVKAVRADGIEAYLENYKNICVASEAYRKAAEAEIERLKGEVPPKSTEAYWWCPNCKQEVDGGNVTFEEFHDSCGHQVIGIGG